MSENYFDSVARIWATDERKNRTFSIYQQIRPLIDTLSPPRTALEIGSGDGLLATLLAKDFASIDCVDASAGMREVAVARIDEMGIDTISVHDERFPETTERTYDVIYSLTAFHHIRDVDAELRLLRRRINPDGILLIMDLTPVSPAFHADFPNFDGHDGFSEQTMRSYLQRSGFSVEAYDILWRSSGETDFGIFLMVGRPDPGVSTEN